MSDQVARLRRGLQGLLDSIEDGDAPPAEQVRILSVVPHTYRRIVFDRVKSKDGKYSEDDGAATPVALAQANVITSEVAADWNTQRSTGKHTVAVDIDMPCHVEPSTTPGHYHLYIDKVLDWPDYLMFLRVLALVGIVEEGYVSASERRGATMLRLPWVRKAVAA